MKRNLLTILVGVLLIIIFALLLFVFQVRTSQVAVITTFGKPTGAPLTEPGAYLKWPWPIQQVHTFDQRIQNFDDKLEPALTADNYSLLTMVYVGWKISHAAEFFPKFRGGSITEAERTLENIVRSAKSAIVGKHPLSDFVSTDEKQLKFAEIEKEMLANIQSQVNSKGYGIEMEYLGIKKLGFPESVTAEVFKRMTSERQVLISKTQYDGEAKASNIRSEADRQSAEMVYNAEAAATKIRGEAQAEAAQYFAVFDKNPALASFLLELNALDLSLKDRATLIFDQHTHPFNLLQGAVTNAVNK